MLGLDIIINLTSIYILPDECVARFVARVTMLSLRYRVYNIVFSQTNIG